MKITENTDRRLVIEHRPWALAGIVWVFGLLALYSGVTGVDMDSWTEQIFVLVLGLGTCFIAWHFFAFLRITFDRDKGTIEHRSLRPFGARSKFIELARIKGARVEASWSDEGARLTRLVLDTEGGVAALEYGYGVGERRVLEDAVNEWLTRPG